MTSFSEKVYTTDTANHYPIRLFEKKV